ncbi:MAG: NAD kinase [Prevotella sp.]
MSERKLKFAIFGNEYQPEKSTVFQHIIGILKAHGAELVYDRCFYDFLTKDLSLKLDPDGVFDEDDMDADFAVTMGGDGTFLKAATRVGPKKIPLMGINTGRLGFLADILPGEAAEAIDAVYNGDYIIEEHTSIEIQCEGEEMDINPYALNDIALLKRDHASMITIRTSVNGEYLVTYQADGLIVSTPTGSTAYSLSNGGPIMIPSTNILCITPVAPHSLNIRPIVINDDSVITFTVESRSHSFLAAIDGRSKKLKEGTTVSVRKAPFTISFVKRPAKRYFSTLREKMMWGVDTRQ